MWHLAVTACSLQGVSEITYRKESLIGIIFCVWKMWDYKPINYSVSCMSRMNLKIANNAIELHRLAAVVWKNNRINHETNKNIKTERRQILKIPPVLAYLTEALCLCCFALFLASLLSFLCLWHIAVARSILVRAIAENTISSGKCFLTVKRTDAASLTASGVSSGSVTPESSYVARSVKLS